MPSPVGTARQFLTDEAVRALDDAVAVACRRCHSQTTSLHAVAALLSPATSTLRDACARARSPVYSPRIQFRALELCVSVSLDRLPSSNSKTLENEPPVSNSLMAAIRRSQANQRRHPETFHLYQMLQQVHGSQSSLSCVKVELKHFILSILDDPIVSRVFGDAGLWSSDIKLAILRQTPVSRFQKSMMFPPLFLCNLSDSDGNLSGFNFPFAVDQEEQDFKRIAQVLAKKTPKNPLLIGVSASNVLTGFTDSLKSGKNVFLPNELQGLNVMCINNEIRGFFVGNLSKEIMGLKLNEVRENAERCTNHGVLVNLGELKVFVNGGSSGAVDYVVSHLSNLVEIYGGKLWLIGAVESYENYMKFTTKFPDLEKRWNLNLLPITYSGGSNLKPSLMGSFVPFGGFFSFSAELENSPRNTLCDLCNKKYEHEFFIFKGGRTSSVADEQSASLASWLQTPESDTSKGTNMIEARIKRKWNDICQRFHQNHQTKSQKSSETSKNAPNQIGNSYFQDFKQLYKALEKKVKHQDDAIHAISQTVSRCRTGNRMHREDIWLVFLGPDRMGKRKIAAALADVASDSRKNLISIDLNFENHISSPNPIFNHQGVNFYDSRFRGKTVTDYIVDELIKKPHSVVLLEHIDKADFLVRERLSQALKTGILQDTHGKEISIKNAIFVTTLNENGEENLRGYSEERILKAKPLQIQILLENFDEPSNSNVSLMPKQSFIHPSSSGKRKFIETGDFEILIPEVKKLKSKSCFDLNLPVEESECDEWLQEFLKHVDEKVVFKPFEFDSVAEDFLTKLGFGFLKAVGSNVVLEIENEVMVQILAAYWLSEKKAVEEWMGSVLFTGFMEAKRKLGLEGRGMLKLVGVEGVKVEEDAECGCLPGRIILNPG